MSEKWYSANEIASKYDVTIQTVYTWIKQKRLAALKIGRDFRISESNIKDFESKCKTM